MSPDDGGGEAPAQSLGSMLENFDAGQSNGEPATTADSTPSADAAPATDTPAGTDAQSADGVMTPADDPGSKAFAQMRINNRQLNTANSGMSELITKVAKAMGIEGDNVTDLMGKLDDHALTKLAAKDNVPVELYKRLNTLEANNTQYQQAQAQASANKGFSALQQEFGLTQAELVAYGTQLDAAGLNPFVKPMDVRADYVSRNLDVIIEKKVQASLARDSKGENHSSTPGNKSGGDGSAAPAITTQQGLKTLLNSFNS